MREYYRGAEEKTGAAKPAEAVPRRLSDPDRINASVKPQKKKQQKQKSQKQKKQKFKKKTARWMPHRNVQNRKRKMPDYSEYRLSKKEWMFCIGKYLVLDGCISYLFFYSKIPFLLFLPGVFLFVREEKKVFQKKREREIKQQFLDGIQMMSASLAAGYSAENALSETLKELCKVYEGDACIIREFRFMEAQISMNRNMEELLLDFGRRSAVDDICSFAEVFMTAKRSGGDLLAVIRNTVFCIRQKQETMQEIETCLAGKVLEQNIMSMIPLLILIYVKLTSPEFLEVMYGNSTGTVVMCICLAVYAAAYFWGRSIVRIEV